MKPKRRSWYEVSHMDYIDRYMWVSAVRKWLSEEDYKPYCRCSHATFRTLKRAKQNALKLREKVRGEVTLTRWFYRNGRRMIQEFILKEGIT